MFGIPEEDADLADVDAGKGNWRRVFVDGQSWVVREVPAPSFDRRGGTHLLFESLEVIRRVRVFPANWLELDDAALYSLCLDLRQRKLEEQQPDPDADAKS
jgi:hypothetical protein